MVSARGWVVMEWSRKDIGAKLVPIASGVGEVEVPGFVNLDGRRAHMAGLHAEEEEFPVLLQNALRVRHTPTVFRSEPFGE